MAGFAVVMGFLTWGVLLLGVAVVLSCVLYVKARTLCPEANAIGRRFRAESAAAPFAALLWIVVALILHTTISNRLAHQSVGFSPDPYVTLPNGYVLGSLNTYDGYIRAPKASTDVPWVGSGYVRNLIDLECHDGRFEGTYLDSYSEAHPQGTDHIREFIFDTRDRSIRTFSTPETTNFGDQQTKVHEDATSYWRLYAAYRHSWPTTVLWLLLLGEEAAIMFLHRHAWLRALRSTNRI